MALFGVRPEKETQLAERMARLGIREADLTEQFIKGSGKGGQKINKTSSCVYLLHRPTGIEIKCQRERSQSLNRFFARRELCDRVEERVRVSTRPASRPPSESVAKSAAAPAGKRIDASGQARPLREEGLRRAPSTD